MKTHFSHVKGFSLIEVMVAVLILGVGILAVSKLQTSLLRSGVDANQRSVAASIAQRKVDDLRRFTYTTTSESGNTADTWSSNITSPLSLAYTHIADNQGGLIGPSTMTMGNQNYSLSWSVNDYYYSGDNTIATTTPSGSAFPNFKTVHVVVNWDGVGDDTNNVVSFDSVIDSYDFKNTDLGGNTATGGTGPVVNYDPLAAPDVVPITLGIGDLKKETSKPLPDVSKKGDSTLVKFETVTYNLNNNTQRREEFRTLACNCKDAGSSDTTEVIKGYVTWDPVEEQITDITTTLSVTASLYEKTDVDNGGGETQDDACTFCCRDGADVSGTTFKVCRLKRIDGVLRILDDWKLVSFNIIPASYFNDSDGIATMTSTLQSANIDLYSSYVTTTVRNLLATGSPSAFKSYTTVDGSFINDTTTFTNNSGSIDHLSFAQGSANHRNIQVRGVYMDYPPTGIFTQITNQSTFYTAATVPLDRVPFFEVNLTQLAGWIPDVSVLKNGANTGDVSFTTTTAYTEQHDDMDNSSCVNTDSASSGRNYVTNEEFFYKGGGTTTTCNAASRGVFYPITVTGAETVTSRIFTGSDGVVDRNVTGNSTVDSGIDLVVVP
jgi:type IV pilus modification protein PilV